MKALERAWARIWQTFVWLPRDWFYSTQWTPMDWVLLVAVGGSIGAIIGVMLT